MEPGRQFNPPATSVTVQAIYDAESIAFLVKWHDMGADRTGKNDPTLPVPPEEEVVTRGAAAGSGSPSGSVFGDQEVSPDPSLPRRIPLQSRQRRRPPPSEFSDAVSIQIPTPTPTSARKPYFIFGDAQNSVDLWFFDLARPEPLQFTGRGSAAIEPNDTGDVTGVASYDQGEWSVIFKRPLRASRRRAVRARRVPAARPLGLGRVLARAWQQARSHVLVLHLRRAASGPIGHRSDGEDGADHSRHRAGRDRLGAVALWLWHARAELGGEPSHPAATRA